MDSRGISAAIRGISYPLKEEYAELHKLDAEKLKFDSEYKESVRKSMVEYGNKVRSEDDSYFCRKAVESVNELNRLQFLIISDCRRPSDLNYFRQNYNCYLIRIECAENVRIQRGFIFTPSIDDQETECALDSFNDWDNRINNDGDISKLDSQLNGIIDIYCK